MKTMRQKSFRGPGRYRAIMNKRDDIYRALTGEPGSFRFDERVAEVFPDMINRSVPGYGLIIPMLGQLARRYAQPGSVVHDLGCSLGAATLVMASSLAGRQVCIIATDNSPAMIEMLDAKLAAEPPATPVKTVCGDIRDTGFNGASMVVLNFTLQFVAPNERADLLHRIAAGLDAGGALVLSEKIRFEDDREQAQQTDWHEDFKRLQGYTDLEIARKRSALERVLEPETEAAHRSRLLESGFSRVTRWFQCFGFCSYLAEK